MTTPTYCQTLVLAAALLAAAVPASAESFDTGSIWEGTAFRDGDGKLKSCAVGRKFQNGTTLSFAQTREQDFFVVLQNTTIDLPQGEKGVVRYSVDQGVGYTANAYLMRDNVVVDLPNTPAVKDLLVGGTWLSLEGVERHEEYSLKGVGESLKALAACMDPPKVATRPDPKAGVKEAKEAKAPQPAPAPTPAAAPAVPASPAPPAPPPAAPEVPAAAEPAPAPQAPAAQASATVATAPTPGGVHVQIGTYVSDTRAQSEFGRLKDRVRPLLDGYEPVFVPLTRSTDGRTLIVLRIAGLANREDAKRLCEELRAQNHQDCKPVAPSPR